ncbi:MAG: hypothetical protein JXB38_09540 [Anaerolineales bacterium]|nr:hypothetical protein [Anaerolineales bacterium]
MTAQETTFTETQNIEAIRKRVRYLIVFFIIALALSGLTAVPLKWGITILNSLFGSETAFAGLWPAMGDWVTYVYKAITTTAEQFPFMFYGTDWLAFGHIVIAISFIGPLRDPVRNVWVIEYGLIACVLVVPVALIMGPIRDIPFFWQVIDCSFGVFGFIPLWLVRRDILRLAKFEG